MLKFRLAISGIALFALALATVFLGGYLDRASAATFTVNSTGDGGDSSPGNGTCDDGSGSCTLRAAIEESNALSGADNIDFNIPGVGPHAIMPGSALPTITDPVIIDGYSQPGASANTNGPGLGSNAMLKIELDGTSAGASTDGLRISAGNSTAEGLVINRFGASGIEITGGGTGNLVQGNFIGTDVTGTVDLGNTDWGVLILGPTNNTIGGTAAAARNIISGNNSLGIEICCSGATGNLVQGNYIGTDATGTLDVGNTIGGVFINGADSNTVGGTVTGAGNVISGNDGRGLSISAVIGATGNLVQGNYIGTDATGSADLGNSADGVHISGVSGNTIGGTAAGARNIISGNSASGVLISGSAATGNLVQGNYIGTDLAGSADLGNSFDGVLIDGGASGNTVGGTAAGAGNVVSGNSGDGVTVGGLGTTGNTVRGNLIGTNAAGNTVLANTGNGVFIGSSGNTVGGTAAGAGNVISGNSNGIQLAGGGGSSNIVQGNFIGTDSAGSLNLGNTLLGIFVGEPGNTIGGTAAGATNTIAYNGDDGVLVSNPGATGAAIRGNSIFNNGGLGIDLGTDGVNANDSGDGDSGPNDLQNYPLLTSAASGGGSTTIIGSLNSTPNSSFDLDFYSSPVCDPSTFGEGKTYLGSSTQTTDGSGNVAFSVTVGTGVSAGDQVTATATNSGTSTSEFSKCVVATLAATPTPTPTPSPTPSLPCPAATAPPGGTCPPCPGFGGLQVSRLPVFVMSTCPPTPSPTPPPTGPVGGLVDVVRAGGAGSNGSTLLLLGALFALALGAAAASAYRRATMH